MLPKQQRFTLYALLLLVVSIVGTTAIANTKMATFFDEVSTVIEKTISISETKTSASDSSSDQIDQTSTAASAMFTTIIQGADETVGCSVQGFTVARFNLCGDFDDRTISLSGGPYGSVSWQLLGGSCSPNINQDCPNTGSCYSQVATGPTFSLNAGSVPSTIGAEYRVVANGQIYYFKVKKSTITQTFVKQDFICGVPGRIQITNLSSAYEYSINSGSGFGPWQGAIFSNLDAGTYIVKTRLRNTPNTCEYPYPPIVIEQRDIDIEATFVDAQCNGDTGSITVTPSNVPGPYKYTLLNSSGVAQEFTAFISDNPYTFSAVGFGTYIVQVETQQCRGDQLAGIDPPRQDRDTSGNPITIGSGINALDASTEVNSSFGCSTITSVDITLNVNGGSAPYRYTVNGGPLQPAFGSSGTNTGTTNFTVNAAGTYNFLVTDSNGCTISASSNVEQLASPDVTAAGVDGDCGNGGARIDFTVVDARGYNLSYRVRTGDPWVTTRSISVPATPGGTLYNGIQVRYQQGGFECTLDLPDITVRNVGTISGNATKISDVTCTPGGGTTGGQIDFVGPFTGGSGTGYVFSIDGVNFTSNTSYPGLSAGIYTPIIRDSGGCRLELTAIEILRTDPPTNIDFIQSNANCGLNSVDVQLVPTSNFSISSFEIISPSPVSNGGNATFVGLVNNTSYRFRITDSNGCSYEESFTPSITSSIRARVRSGGDLRVCPGDTDGNITFLIDGFANSYSYAVSPGGFSGSAQSNNEVPITGLGAGSYTITITDDDTGCTSTASATVAGPTNPLALTANVTAMSCQNNNVGRVEAQATGGFGSFRYELVVPTTPTPTTQGPRTSRFFGNLTLAGTYTLRVIDAEGCTTEQTFDLTPVSAPSIALDAADYCFAPGNPAQVTVSSTAGSAPLSSHQYRINGGALQATGVFNNLVPGTYTIQVVDGNNCRSELQVRIPPQIQINLDLIAEIPCGGDGEMGINIIGGDVSDVTNTSYTIFRDGTPVTGHTAQNIPSSTFSYNVPLGQDGQYTVEVTDNNGCTNSSAPLRFSPPSSITAVADPVGPSCGDPNSGFVEIFPDVANGTPAFQIAFAPPGFLVDDPFTPDPSNTYTYSSQTVYSGLSAGTYEYIVKDARNCTTGVQTVVVTDDTTSPPDATVTSLGATCNGGDVSGGIRIDSVVDGVENFIIIIEDNFGNEILRRDDLPRSSFPIDIIDVTLTEGNYTIITIDRRGCLDRDPLNVSATDLQIIPDFTTPVVCDQGNTPQCVDIVSGTGPFEIRLLTDPAAPYLPVNNAPRRHCFSNLIPGSSYTVQVLDQGTNCEYIEVVTVPDGPNDIDVQLAIDSGTCNGQQVGLEYEIFGATGPFNIEVRNLDTGAVVVSEIGYTATTGSAIVPQGPYSISVIDTGTDCTGGDTEDIVLDRPRVDVINNRNANCNELGQLTVRGSGGTPFGPGALPGDSRYEYAFTDAGVAPLAGDYGTETTVYLPGSLVGIVYDIWVRDAGGCEFNTSATIVQLDPDLPEPIFNVNNQCNGTIPPLGFIIEVTMPAEVENPTFTLGGETQVPTYDPTVPTTASFNVGSNIGVFNVEVIDSKGCNVVTTVEVFQILSASGGFSTDPTCEEPDGIITIEANGGSGDFTYRLTGTDLNMGAVDITDPNADGIFENILPGEYEVLVTDNIVVSGGANCFTTVSNIISAPPVQPLIADTGQTNISCNGANDGGINATLSPGTDADGIQTFNLYNASLPLTGSETPIDSNTSGSFENLSPGTYVVQVVTNKLCTAEAEATLIQPPVFEITATDEIMTCEPGANRFSTATVSATIVQIGNGGPYSYRLDPADSYQSQW